MLHVSLVAWEINTFAFDWRGKIQSGKALEKAEQQPGQGFAALIGHFQGFFMGRWF